MAKLKADKRNDLKDSDFGIPEKRMYPLNDEAHVKAAARMFGHASNEDKPALARKILRKAKEYGIDSSGWKQVNAWAHKDSDSKPKQEAYVPLSEFNHYFQEGIFSTLKQHHADNKQFKESIANIVQTISDTANTLLNISKNVFISEPKSLKMLIEKKMNDYNDYVSLVTNDLTLIKKDVFTDNDWLDSDSIYKRFCEHYKDFCLSAISPLYCFLGLTHNLSKNNLINDINSALEAITRNFNEMKGIINKAVK